MEPYSRIVSLSLEKFFFQGKALVVIGARQVGKTTMLQNLGYDTQRPLWLNADELNVRERLTDPSIAAIKHIIGSC